MKTKIIALCILATLTLTACTGKEPPVVIIDDSGNINSTQDEFQSGENTSSEIQGYVEGVRYYTKYE